MLNGAARNHRPPHGFGQDGGAVLFDVTPAAYLYPEDDVADFAYVEPDPLPPRLREGRRLERSGSASPELALLVAVENYRVNRLPVERERKEKRRAWDRKRWHQRGRLPSPSDQDCDGSRSAPREENR